MFLSMSSIIIMAIGSVFAVGFIILLLAGKKYDSMVEPLDDKEYPLNKLYVVGFVILDLIKYSYASKSERKRRQDIALIYGQKYAEYYLRVNAAERVTLAYLLVVIGLGLYGVTEELLIVGVFLMFAFVAFYYVSNIPKDRLQKKTEEIIDDFADVVSKLALLVNAGMIMREAWEKVAYTGDGELYKEMQLVIVNINNGVSEIDAYSEFGTRCIAPEIKKFTSTIIQGVVKGNRELVEMIKEQSREILEAKRFRVKQQGEQAANKLLVPMCIMFVGILVMIIVPIFANLGV